MRDHIKKLKIQLDDTREYLHQVIEQADGNLDKQVYSDGAQWTIHDLLIHLMLSARGMAVQARRIAKGGEGVPEDFDLERYNSSSVAKRREMSLEQLRQEMASDRKELFTWLDSIKDEEVLDYKGRHATGGVLTVEGFLEIIAGHELSHADDIASVLRS